MEETTEDALAFLIEERLLWKGGVINHCLEMSGNGGGGGARCHMSPKKMVVISPTPQKSYLVCLCHCLDLLTVQKKSPDEVL